MNDSLKDMSTDMKALADIIKQNVVDLELKYGVVISRVDIDRQRKPMGNGQNFISITPTFTLVVK